MRPTGGQQLARGLLLIISCCAHAGSRDPVPAAAEVQTQAQAVALLAQLEFPVGKKITYREQQQTPLLKSPGLQTGDLWIDDNGAFVMQVLTPRVQRRRLHQGQLSVTRARPVPGNPGSSAMDQQAVDAALANARTRTITLNPEHSGQLVLLAITQLLSGDVDALLQNFNLEGYPGANWQVILKPGNIKLKRRLQRIVLQGSATRLLSIRTERSAEAWQLLEFGPNQANQPTTP